MEGIIILLFIIFGVSLALISGINAIKIAWAACVKVGSAKSFFTIVEKNMAGNKFGLLIVGIIALLVWAVLAIKIMKSKDNQKEQ